MREYIILILLHTYTYTNLQICTYTFTYKSIGLDSMCCGGLVLLSGIFMSLISTPPPPCTYTRLSNMDMYMYKYKDWPLLITPSRLSYMDISYSLEYMKYICSHICRLSGIFMLLISARLTPTRRSLYSIHTRRPLWPAYTYIHSPLMTSPLCAYTHSGFMTSIVCSEVPFALFIHISYTQLFHL